MDFVAGCLVEAFFELFAEGYVSLISAFMPNREMSDRAQKAIGIVLLIVGLLLFVGLIAGIILLVESGGTSALGKTFVGINIAYVVVSVVLKIVSCIKNKA